MASQYHELITGSILGILLLVLATMVVIVLLVLKLRRVAMGSMANSSDENQVTPIVQTEHVTQMGFMRQGSWLAVRRSDLRAIQSALALHHAKPCSWTDGLSGEGDHTLFIAPPVSGWVLVMGPALPDPAEDIDACYRFLTDISRKLGHVQFFAVNYALNHHTWASLEGGRVLRAYAWAGKTLWNEGDFTHAERQLRMKCQPYGEPVRSFSTPDSAVFNADKVHLLAARWSLDPAEIDERFIEHEWGIVGETSPHF